MEYGIEREMLVYNDDLTVFNYPCDKLSDSITVDFFDNQIELVTKVHSNYYDTLKELEDLLNDDSLIKKKIWPLSQPGFITDDMKYENKDYEYRKYLLSKYSKQYMAMNGIHLNISFTDRRTPEQYFELLKKITYFAPLIVQFYSFTPVYQKGINDDNLVDIGKNKGLKDSISLRNSIRYGYLNEDLLDIDYSNLKAYNDSIDKLIKEKKIKSKKELYAKIRMKKSQKDYLEIRFIDINPYSRIGITVDQLTLIENIVNYIDSLEIDITNAMIKKANEQFEKVVTNGQDKNIEITIESKTDSLFNATVKFLDDIIDNIDSNKKIDRKVLKEIKENYMNNTLHINEMINEIKNEKLSVKDFGMKHIFEKEQFNFLYPEYNIELSTKILLKEAEKRGYKIKVIDEMTSAVIISNSDDKQTVIQATKTNKDTYANILLMENKVLSKQILQENNINVAKGIVLEESDKIDYQLLQSKKIVIKPYDTNFGLGITVLPKNSDNKAIDKALAYAFKYSKRVLVENFFTGIEYRFLVISDKVISVIQRTPASVKGNGIDTIKQLVDKKNQSPLRNKGYITPVEYINLTEIEKDYLKKQDLTENSILEKDQIIYLRENTNVSTGGETHEELYLMNNYFKDIAVRVAKSLDVNICGVDMIINEKFTDYIVVEANFNPAIQIHTYPIYGIGINPASAILKLLFNKNHQ